MINDQHQSSFLGMAKLPSGLRKATNIIRNIAFGALGGYLVYSLTNAIKRPFSIVLNETSPIPAILVGILGVAAIEIIGLTYDIGVRILGDREFYENLPFPEAATTFDRFRQHAWCIVTQIEKLQAKTDAFVSHLLKIRSSEEIKKRKIPPHKLNFLEILRHAFQEQTLETINEPFPSTGYTMLAWNFTKGVIDRINQLYKDIHLEKIALLQKRKELDEMLC